ARQQDGELFTAVTRHHFSASAYHLRKKGADPAQTLVAGRVTQPVVELLELVQVEQDQRDRQFVTPRAVPFLHERAFEEPAVGDSGQIVLEREDLQAGVRR